jgi:peptide-methionine (R)-S-oxide reductase
MPSRIGTMTAAILAGFVMLAAPAHAGTPQHPATSPPPGSAKPATVPPTTGGGTRESTGVMRCSDEEWRRRLTPEQYRVLRQKGTEMPYSGALTENHEPGWYRCAACGLVLFTSGTKFDSGSGWPSFWSAAEASRVRVVRDTSLGMVREEVRCARCGGHLGHLFDDGPAPTGARYCINSAALSFERDSTQKAPKR